MTPDTPPRVASAPTKIGRYEIRGRIDKGSMGVVYGARDAELDRDVALKVMTVDIEDEPDTRERFYREARITSNLLHRNIVTVLDFGEDDGRLYLVMELLKGTTLLNHVKSGTSSSIEEKLDLMVQTCEGLAVAHVKNITHRDIKPGNLFVLKDGGLKILDFGVARVDTSSMTASGLVVGTPDYMSPEQARGKAVDVRSDVFSAGGVFYFILTGRKPFGDTRELHVVLQRVVREDPLPIRDMEAPPALARVVMKALAKKPEDRYANAAEMAADLIRFKRQFDTETRQLRTTARERFHAIELAYSERLRLRRVLDVVSPEDEEAALEELRASCPGLTPLSSDSAASGLSPFRREAVVAYLDRLESYGGGIDAQNGVLAECVVRLERAGVSLQEGSVHRSYEDFDYVVRAFPTCTRAREGHERSRTLLGERQALENHVQALLLEARAAEKAQNWHSVVDLCEQVLNIRPGIADAASLRDGARSALARDEQARRSRIQEQLNAGARALRRGQLDDAEGYLAKARAIQPDAAAVQEFEEQIAAARAAVIAADALALECHDAIERARAEFAEGDRRAAVERLRAFAIEHPSIPALRAEAERLEKEAKRLEELERRQAEANTYANRAQQAWDAGQVREGLAAADAALSLDPSHAAATHLRSLARARLRELEAIASRDAEVSDKIRSARGYVSRRRFDKAEREARKALELDPTNTEAGAIVAEVQRLQADLHAARDRQAIADARTRAANDVLRGARQALKAADYGRAAWTAQSALEIDPDNKEALEILARASAANTSRAAEGFDPDATVDEQSLQPALADPDDTAAVHPVTGQAPADGLRGWASSLVRRLHSSNGQTLVEWVMIAGFLTTFAIGFGLVVPGALRAFVRGLTLGIRTIAP